MFDNITAAKNLILKETEEITKRFNSDFYNEDWSKILELRNKVFEALNEPAKNYSMSLVEREDNKYFNFLGKRTLKDDVCYCFDGNAECRSGCGY